MLCTGTWVGFFLSLTFYSPISHFIGLNEYYSVFFDGMLSAGSVWGINSIVEWFEENRPSNK
jgi:ATP sulfurylase